MPAKAGIQLATFDGLTRRGQLRSWIPAFAGMTGKEFGERWDDSVARLVPSRWYPILLPGSVRTAFYLNNLSP